MKVLIVFSSSELGGAERSLTRMALQDSPVVSYTLSTLDGVGPWVDWAMQEGGAPIVFGSRKEGMHSRFSLQALLRLVAFAREVRFDAIYVIGFRYSLILRFLRFFLSGALLVQGVRWNPNSDSWLDRIFRVAERLTGFLIDCYICNSNAAAKTLSNRLNVSSRKISVVYNGLYTLPHEANSKERDSKNVIVLANLNERKGHLEFLEVVKLVLNAVKSAHFYFVGRDDMNGVLQDKITNLKLDPFITLTGYQSDVDRWLKMCQVMALPSKRDEGCPTSILEGFAYALPVVAYTIDGIPELVDNGSDGFLVSAGEHQEFASSIISLLDNPEMAHSMGLKGKSKIERKFMLKQCVEMHDHIFCTLASLKI